MFPGLVGLALWFALFLASLIGAAAFGLIEWITIGKIFGGMFALALVGRVIEGVSAHWRISIERVRYPMRATTARLKNGLVTTFYSAASRAFIVSLADIIKERHAGSGLPKPTTHAYRSEGVEHLEARWSTPENGSATETVLTFWVDSRFDDRLLDSNGIDTRYPVGDMVDALVLVALIDAAARGLPPWNGSPIEQAAHLAPVA